MRAKPKPNKMKKVNIQAEVKKIADRRNKRRNLYRELIIPKAKEIAFNLDKDWKDCINRAKKELLLFQVELN